MAVKLWSRLSVGVTNDMRDSRSRQRITLIRRRLHTVSTQPDDIQTSIANIQRMLFVAHSDSCLIWKIENATVIFLISLCIISLILDKATKYQSMVVSLFVAFPDDRTVRNSICFCFGRSFIPCSGGSVDWPGCGDYGCRLMISRDGKCAAMLRETRLFNLKFYLCKTLIFLNTFL